MYRSGLLPCHATVQSGSSKNGILTRILALMTDKMRELSERAAGEAELFTCSTTVPYSSSPYNCGDFHNCHTSFPGVGS